MYSQCNSDIESCAVEIQFNNLPFIIVAIYRPPSGNMQNFTLELESIINSSDLRNCSVIIAGDFNINLNDLDNYNVLNLTSALNSLHFIPLITKPTRFSSNLDSIPTTLDHIWTNCINFSYNGLLYFDATDHLPCFCFTEVPSHEIVNSKIKIQSRPFSDQNFQKFTEKLSSIDWDDLLDYSDVDSSLSTFIEQLNVIYRKYFPLKTKFISEKRMKNKWITPEIKNLINLKSNYFKQFRLGLISRDTNNRMKNKLNHKIKKC